MLTEYKVAYVEMKIFISYCDNDGLVYAEQSAFILEACGYTVWYFDRDKTPGVPRIYDITKHIRSWCDIIIYLCTSGSSGSRGQWEEIGHWDRTNKQIIVVNIDDAIVLEVIDTRVYLKINGGNFSKEFADFVNNDLCRAITMYEEWNKQIKVEKK